MAQPLPAVRVPAGRRPLVMDRRLLVLWFLAVATAVVDWWIGQAWTWPAAARLAWLLATALLAGGLYASRRLDLAAAAGAASLYAVPVVGAIVRWHLAPGSMALIGDGSLQIQIARTVLMGGRDPYGFDYAQTGLAQAPWNQPFPNPALHHLVYWPGTIVLPLPLQAAGQAVLGWWDERIALLLVAIAVWLLVRALLGGPAGALAAAAFFVIPGHSFYAVLGDNDLPMLALLLGAMLAGQRRAFLLAAVLAGLAVATKQTALVALPPLAAWIVAQGPERGTLVRGALVGLATALAIMLPFVLWNPGAFWADTVAYNLGSGPQSYPIQGYGVGSLLLHLGVIRGPRDSFPFFILQAAAVLPAWVFGWRWIVRRPRAGEALVWIGIALFAFLVCNRFFQPTYLVLVGELIGAGLVGSAGAVGRPAALPVDTGGSPAVESRFAP